MSSSASCLSPLRQPLARHPPFPAFTLQTTCTTMGYASQHTASRRAPVPQQQSSAGPSTGDRRKRMSTTSGSSSGREDARSIGQWRIGRTIGKGSSGTYPFPGLDGVSTAHRLRTGLDPYVQPILGSAQALAHSTPVASRASIRVAVTESHDAKTEGEFRWLTKNNRSRQDRQTPNNRTVCRDQDCAQASDP